MALIDKIRADALNARKARAPEASVLVTLIGEIDTKTKTFSPARSMTDDEVVAVVRKFLKNIDEVLAKLPDAADPRAAGFAAEKAALERYMPRQLGEAELRAFVAARPGLSLGEIMGALKAEHAGCYDGRLASSIVKEALAA